MDTFPNNLLSMGQFCDADCTVTFTKTDAYVHNSDGLVVLHGFRETTGARMWRFNIHAPHPHTALQASPSQPHAHVILGHLTQTPKVKKSNNDGKRYLNRIMLCEVVLMQDW
jgi:hypothetical protein